MKSRPTSTPAARPPSQQTPGSGQPRETIAHPTDPAWPGEAREAGPDLEKLLAHTQEALSIAEHALSKNQALGTIIRDLCQWLLVNLPAMNAAGLDTAPLFPILAEAIAKLNALAQEDQGRE